MALVLKDRVKETTTTQGTGTYTLAGAVAGFEAFSEIGDGNTTYYCCTDGTDFEVGVGTYTASGTTLARTTILQSSNSDAAVDWASGTRDIFCTQPAEKAVFLNASDHLETEGGVIALKNGGTQSEVRLYCESGNAHYSSIKAATHADLLGVGNVTLTLPNATGTLLGTNNADDPATTTSASDAEHVLINNGGVLKKIDPSDLGIGSGGGSYANSDVDTHLNTSTASANEVLSWNGSDYDWVAQSGGGGGGGSSNLTGLSDVNITSVADGDLLRYNGTASEWQNTNLGLTITPSISSITSGGSTTIGTGGPVTVVVVPSSGSYQSPAYFAEVRNSTNTSTVITDANISRSGGTFTFTAPSSTGSYIFRVKVQDFGDIASEFVTQSFTVSTPTGPRYLRLSGSGGSTHSMVMDLTFYTGTGQTGTVYPDQIGHMTSNTAPSPLVASSSGSYSSTYDDYEAFDANTTSTTTSWWNLSQNSTYADWYLQLDLGAQISSSIQSASIKFFASYGWHGGAQTLTLETSTDGTNFTSVATLSKGNVGGVFNIG